MFFMSFLAAIYLTVLSVGIILTREKPSELKKEEPHLKNRVSNALNYLVTDVLRNKDFWLLWASRYFLLICGAGIISHWKTFSFTQNRNDKESEIEPKRWRFMIWNIFQVVSLFGGVR